MSIKGNDLITLEKCEKMYQLNKFMVTEKNKYYYISVAIKKIIKEILPLNGENFKLAIENSNMSNRLNELLPDKVFLPLVKKETIKELVEQLKRYLKHIKSNNYRVLRTDITQDIKFNGELITVSADFIFENNTGLEIVKIKRKAPKLSYRARKFENKPKNDIELYLLYLLGKHLYSNKTISSSFHHMAGKRDKDEINPIYEVKRGDNIINYNFAEKEDKEEINSRLLELINKTNSTEFYKTGDNCEACPYKHICNYKKPRNTDLEPVEKIVKASKDFVLTDSQRKAVLFNEGIARINAGAGSGKTTVVALRVAELILGGCKPEDILLITFTNKGASEMREKIAYWLKKEEIEDEANNLNITTFNAWGNDIVMKNYEALGFTETPTLIDKVQKYDIIFELLGKNPKIQGFDYKNPVMNFRYARGAVAELNNIFDYIKSYNATTPEKLKGKVEESEIYKVLDMYKQYNNTLKVRNLIEYQDQMNLLIQLIENENDLLNKYDYKHIIVDEFQDSDKIQINLILFLSKQPNFESLMVVGDDSQSIFGFRNTSQENILNFHLMFNEVKDIEIIENFRSTPEIVALANALNDLNKNKIDKELISGAKHGDIPMLVFFNNFDMEYEFIAKKTKELMKEYNPEDFAIIARTKYELFEIEKYLKQENIPYIIDIPEPLLNNTNIHIAKSLITFLENPEITQGIFEYLFIITEEFKDMEEKEIQEMIKEEIEIIKEIIGNTDYIENEEEINELQNKVRLDLFFNMLDLIDDKDLNKFLEELKENNYNFKELKDYLYKFIKYEDNKIIEKDEEKYKAVILTTAHSSKGKEFPIVFNTISKYSAGRDNESIEEERRLLFVSITRAKEKLFITHQIEEENPFSKSYKGYPNELANTGKCITGRGVRKKSIA